MKKKRRQKKLLLIQGMAVVIDNEGLEHIFEKDEYVFVQEIENMREHCVVLRGNKPPQVGFHLERFRLLTDKD